MTKEEKDKLIELSDLNREDNIKYISSEAQGIAITLDSDRLAPNICKLERAYICGRRKSEKQLEEKNIELLGKLAFTENALNNAKAQIEKMKCCGNCENRCGQEECANCHNYSKWKFKQAEQFYEEIVE